MADTFIALGRGYQSGANALNGGGFLQGGAATYLTCQDSNGGPTDDGNCWDNPSDSFTCTVTTSSGKSEEGNGGKLYIENASPSTITFINCVTGTYVYIEFEDTDTYSKGRYVLLENINSGGIIVDELYVSDTNCDCKVGGALNTIQNLFDVGSTSCTMLIAVDSGGQTIEVEKEIIIGNIAMAGTSAAFTNIYSVDKTDGTELVFGTDTFPTLQATADIDSIFHRSGAINYVSVRGFIFDGHKSAGDRANYCFRNSTVQVNYWYFDNCAFINADVSGFYFPVLAGNSSQWRMRRCEFNDNIAMGLDSTTSELSSSIFIECIFDGNGSYGARLTGFNKFTRCRFTNNTTIGLYAYSVINIYSNCLFADNGGSGLFLNGSTDYVYGCVIDNNGGHGIEMDAGTVSHVVESCRITNNTSYGISADDANVMNREDYNVFFGNGSGDLNNIVSGENSYGDDANHISDPADDGYVADTYNVKSGAEGRSIEIDLYWDEWSS